MSWYFPDRYKLRDIVYNSSFGFRERRGSTASTPLIRSSRLAIAIAVVNRVKQQYTPAPGWGEPPHTERAVFVRNQYTDLANPGNQTAYDECLAVAIEALNLQNLPLTSERLLSGAGMYCHTQGLPGPHFRHYENTHLVAWYGPMWSPIGDRYLGVYVNRQFLDRALRGA